MVLLRIFYSIASVMLESALHCSPVAAAMPPSGLLVCRNPLLGLAAPLTALAVMPCRHAEQTGPVRQRRQRQGHDQVRACAVLQHAFFGSLLVPHAFPQRRSMRHHCVKLTCLLMRLKSAHRAKLRHTFACTSSLDTVWHGQDMIA